VIYLDNQKNKNSRFNSCTVITYFYCFKWLYSFSDSVFLFDWLVIWNSLYLYYYTHEEFFRQL